MNRRTFKQCFFYKYKKLIVKLKNRSLTIANILDSKRKVYLNDVQKPLFEICLKMISDKTTELSSNSIDHSFNIENSKYLVIIRTSSIISEENCSISLIDYSSEFPAYIDTPFPSENIKTIIFRFNKEVLKRMKKRQVLKTTKISAHLNSILEDINKIK